MKSSLFVAFVIISSMNSTLLKTPTQKILSNSATTQSNPESTQTDRKLSENNQITNKLLKNSSVDAATDITSSTAQATLKLSQNPTSKSSEKSNTAFTRARKLDSEPSMDDVEERLYAIEDKIDHLLLHAGHDMRQRTAIMTPWGVHHYPTYYNSNSLNNKLAIIDYIYQPQMRPLLGRFPTQELNFGHAFDHIGQDFQRLRFSRPFHSLGVFPSTYNPYIAALGSHYRI